MTAPKNRSAILAVVFDCDDTLAPDTTSQLLEQRSVDLKNFWTQRVGGRVKDGWDPATAFMTEMVDLSDRAEKELYGLSRQEIEKVGQNLKFFQGVPEMFPQMKAMIEKDSRFQDFGVMVEFYVISGGLEDLIRASPLGTNTHTKDIWGSNFAYDDEGKICAIKNVVSFTEKTRYLFNIQKGIVGPKYRSQPYAVNARLDEHELRIPFENMVYVGDGPSDIPCMSLLEKAGGHVVGILSEENPYKTYASTYGRRAQFTIPHDYRPGQIGRKHLDSLLKTVAERIVRRIEFLQQRPIPGH